MKEENYKFEWKDIGDINLGRPNLGTNTNVAVYRLMQYTMRSVLTKEHGSEKTDQIFYNAGKLAGIEFCKNLLDKNLDFQLFIKQLERKLIELNIGILRIEQTDFNKMDFTFVVEEDLDCSGLPITDETVCNYDEGFIAGILKEYSGIEFTVKETDCWSKGDRVCRFKIKKN